MSPGATVVLIIVVVLVIGALGLAVIFSLMADLGGDGWEDTRDVSREVLIEEGGHFRLLLSDSWGSQLLVNMSVRQLDGSRFDVYIMDSDQYENAYGNLSSGAFSTLARWQNVSALSDSVSIDDPRGPISLVVDNVDMPLVPGSTVPEGPIEVALDLAITSRYDY